MNKDFSSHSESEEFKTILSKYEEACNNNLTSYFDSDQLIEIIEHYTAHGKYKKAYEATEYALRLHPDNMTAWILKVRLLLDDNQMIEAKKILESIPDKSDYEVRLLKAEILLSEGEKQKADAILQGCLEENTDDKDCYTDIAYLYLDNESYQDALTYFHKAEKLFPNDTEITEGLAECYFEAKIPEKAIEYTNLLLDEDPYSVEYWNTLGKVYFCFEDFHKAIEAYEFSVTIDKENKHAFLMLGHCYSKLENFAKAEEYYQLFNSVSETPDASYYYLGMCYASMGKYEKAIDSFTKGIETDGEPFFQPIDIYSCISTCHAKLGNKEEAIHYIDLAIEGDPESADLYLNKAKSLLEFGNVQEALEILYDTIGRLSSDVLSIMEIGITFAEYQKLEWAISTFQLLETTYPLAYHIFTGLAYKVSGDTSKYREHMEQVSELGSPELAESLTNESEEVGLSQMKDILMGIYNENLPKL